VSQKWTGIIIL